MDDFRILFIIDNNPHNKGTMYQGIPVKGIEEVEDIVLNYKIVVMTTNKPYQDISIALKTKFAEQIQEYREYCGIEQFLAEWYWKYRHQVCLLQVDTTVTLKCALNCKDCNMFIPYQPLPPIYSFKDMKADFDLIFNYVDYFSSCILLGGEPLLNPDLSQLIEYLNLTYNENIGQISVITNGTLMPSEELVRILRNVMWRLILATIQMRYHMERGCRI